MNEPDDNNVLYEDPAFVNAAILRPSTMTLNDFAVQWRESQARDSTADHGAPLNSTSAST